MTKVLLICSDPDTQAAIGAVLSELDGFSEPSVLYTAAQARIEYQRANVDVALIDMAVENGQGLAVAREMSVIDPLVPICLLAARIDSDSILSAMDSGARAILPLPPSLERYAERLRSLSNWGKAASKQIADERQILSRTVGKVIAVVGSKGGVGASLTAITVAKAAVSHGHTALLDLDLRAGDMASYCGIRVRHSVVDLVSVAAEIGGREISEVAYPVKYGIDLFPAPEHGEFADEMTESASRQILQAMRYQYDYLIVDCGSHLDDATAAALDLANLVTVVCSPEVPALRAVRRFKESTERLDLAQGTQMSVILNRTSRNNEIQPTTAAKLVGMPLVGVVPDSTTKLEPALNSGALLEFDLPPLTAVGKNVVKLLEPGVVSKRRSDMEAVEILRDGTPTTLPSNEQLRRSAPLPPTIPPQSFAHAAIPPRPVERTRSENDGSVKRKRGRLSPRDKTSSRSHEKGATAVEFVGSMLIASGLFVLFLEILLLAGVSLIAHSAAQDAARDYAVGKSQYAVEKDLEHRVPKPLSSNVELDKVNGKRSARVTLHVPGLLPGLGPVASTANVDWER